MGWDFKDLKITLRTHEYGGPALSLDILQRQLNTNVEFDYHDRFHFKFNLQCILNLHFVYNFTSVLKLKLIFKAKINHKGKCVLKIYLKG